VALPIRARLTIWYSAVLALTLLLTGTLVVLEVQADLRNGTDRALSLAASEIKMGYHAPESDSENDFREVADASLGGLPRAGFAAQLVTSSGRVLVQTGMPPKARARPLVDGLTIAQALAGRPVFTAASLGGTGYRVLVVPFRNGADPQALVVATSLARSEHAIRNLLVALLAAGAVGLVLAAGSGWWLARRALQPVARMTEEAGLIGAGGGLTERIQVPKAADELGRLAETLNGMLTRLERAVTQQRRFVADVSHELRTPLTVMRSEIDVELASDALSGDARSVLESTGEEIQRMAGIVENLLTLARIDEEELHLIRRRCDLRELAETTARELRPIAGQRDVTIRLTGNRGPVEADPQRLQQVIRNLLDNAIRYSPRGGIVIVEVANHHGQVELTVRDEGPGIEPPELEHVFERFYRGDPSHSPAREGSGLGLAICREIAEAHGGRMSATSARGRGSTFRLRLPALKT
jgi:two-component system, OmpR family, sensor kinase